MARLPPSRHRRTVPARGNLANEARHSSVPGFGLISAALASVSRCGYPFIEATGSR